MDKSPSLNLLMVTSVYKKKMCFLLRPNETDSVLFFLTAHFVYLVVLYLEQLDSTMLSFAGITLYK